MTLHVNDNVIFFQKVKDENVGKGQLIFDGTNVQLANSDVFQLMTIVLSDSDIVVDGTFFGDSFEQDWSWDDSGTTISGI